MRFERLHIPAFGPFTNLELNFPAGGGDLHIIYGFNEAGKSSLLRTFRDLLFGIHGQSPDNFLHEYKNMRIMAEIINQKMDRLTFQRRKGNKNTLLDADGGDLPDDTLAPFLGSVDQAYFSAMFGLGTKELREGAEQLLHGKGDIGNALFSASMGGTPVQKVLAALADESDKMFKGRSTANVSIRPSVNAYKDLLGKSRAALVSPDVWEAVEADLAKAEAEKIKLDSDILAISRDLEWLSRCEDAFPTVGRFIEEMQRLAELPVLPNVSSDFVERARIARKVAGEALDEVNRLAVQKAKLEEQLAACQTAPALLAEADALDRLHQDLGVYLERKNYLLIDLGTKLAGLEVTLRSGMQNLALTGDFAKLAPLQLTSATRLACEESANTLMEARKKHEQSTEKTENIQTQIKTLEMQLNDLPETDLAPLRQTLSVAAEATEANKTLAISASKVSRLKQELKIVHKKLKDAPPDLDATGDLSVPKRAVIRRFNEKMAGIRQDIDREQSRIIDEKKQIEILQAELDRMERRGELPSEQALSIAREHRDHGWNLVLAEWKEGGSKAEFVPGIPLEEAFPLAIVRADHIADELRQQAEAVAQAEEKRFQIAQSEKKEQAAEAAFVQFQSELKDSQDDWDALWLLCEIKPLTPAEMEEWFEDWTEFTGLLSQLRNAEDVLAQKNAQVQESKILLAHVISAPKEKEFKLLYDEAVRQVRAGEELAGRKSELAKQIQSFKKQLDPLIRNNTKLSMAVKEVSIEWQARCQQVGIPETISPKSGLDLLQERKELLAKFASWQEASTTSERITMVVIAYEQAVNEKAVALGAHGDTTEAQETDLWHRLAAARTNQTRYEQLAEQVKETTTRLEDSFGSSSQANRTFEELICLAKLGAVDALEPLLANLELRDRAQSQIDTFRDTLSGLARGQTVDEFLTRVGAEDSETLSERKGMLQDQKHEKETALQTIRDELYVLNEQKAKLEAAGDAAADYHQQAESYVAGLKQDAARFVRLRLAAHFLQNQIERFRKENQGPLLEKSGAYFKTITQNAFGGLGAEFNADDTPVLVGLRPDQTSVSIVGMSDGSRDQLYLALRLAALDQHLEKHEPMPLILDDLLITFDDNRAAAILPPLSELAQRTQIFLFTHHAHLVEICRQTLGEGAFHLHQLNANINATGN